MANHFSGSYARLFSDAEIERIYAGAVDVLLDTGFRIQDATLLTRLKQKGARVDEVKQVFWPTRGMMRDLEACLLAQAPQSAQAPLRRPLPRGNAVVYNAPLYYDASSGERRAATLGDVTATLKACHELPEVTRVGPALAASDVPYAIEPLMGVAEAIKTTNKELLAVELVLAGQLPFMEELETIAAGSQVRYTTAGTSIDRFTIDARGAEMLLTTWRRNGLAHWWVASCPTAGSTAPVTLAGAVAVGVAETLGGWFAGWALNEGVRFSISPCSSVLDMRTTRVLFSTPEALLIDAGQFQVFHRLFGVTGNLLADYTDAKTPGMQALHDKVFKVLGFEWLTCGVVNHHYGKLDAGKAFSPAQMVIDFEINQELARLAHGIEVSDETLALDLIREYALDHARIYLDADHTVRHFRQTLWQPLLMDRSSWAGDAAERRKERQAVDEAESRWRRARQRYQPPAIPIEKIRAVDDVITRARAQLCAD